MRRSSVPPLRQNKQPAHLNLVFANYCFVALSTTPQYYCGVWYRAESRQIHHVSRVVIFQLHVVCRSAGNPRCSIVNSVAKNGVAISKYPFSTSTSSFGLVIMACDKSPETFGAPGNPPPPPPRPSSSAHPIPISTALVVIVLVRTKFQFFVVILIQHRGECAADRRPFGIALRVFTQQIPRVAGESRVNAGRPSIRGCAILPR